MENKTALEQLIERIDNAIVLNKESDHLLAIERGMIYNLIRDHAKQLLEEEKRQMQEYATIIANAVVERIKEKATTKPILLHEVVDTDSIQQAADEVLKENGLK